MDTPLLWLKSLLPDLNANPKEIADRLTMFGTKVEKYEELDKNLENIVVGKIESIKKHEDADKLIVCQVNIGEKTVQIVTGADNVNVGDLVPIVLDGGKVAASRHSEKADNGIKIKKGKLRGVMSEGMMCSIGELGSSKHFYPEAAEDGIYIFDEEVPVGSDAVEHLQLHDTLFEYEITSNRVDCFSILGIAREAAAAFGHKFEEPVIRETGNGENVDDYVKVEIVDPDLCKRLCARVVKNIKIAPSPKWMQRRLAACGIRPINNIVDITNYVLKEYGQPMHAYDISRLNGNKLVAKRATENMEFVTLDGQSRKLSNDMIMIYDSDRPVGLAGIMGGQNSMIKDDVQTIVFEAACFDGTNIRHSSKKLGLRTESSALFEKGLNPHNAYLAVQRACELVEMLGCGEVVGGIADALSVKDEEQKLDFEPDRINALLGTDISKDEMLTYFERLGFKYDSASNKVIVPWFRMDIEGMADLAEEVARSYGYDKIPTTLPSAAADVIGGVQEKERIEKIVAAAAIGYGFSQSMSYSFESAKVFDKLLFPEDAKQRQVIELMNPLGEDYKVMRTTALNGLLNCLSANYSHRNKSVRLFEIAKVYLPYSLPLDKLPDERVNMMLGFYDDGDFYDMKAVVEEILSRLGISKESLMYENDESYPFLHLGRQAKITLNDSYIGYIGELHKSVADSYKISGRVYVACLDLTTIQTMTNFDTVYKGIAKFPASSRDLSLILNKEVKAYDIEKTIKKNAGSNLESLELFDIYEGENIGNDKRSLAYSLSFRALDRTLSDEEVQSHMDKVIKALNEMGVVLRG